MAVIGERTLVVYHVEPWREYDSIPIYKQPVLNRRSVLQLAELTYEGGKLPRNRDQKVRAPLELPQ